MPVVLALIPRRLRNEEKRNLILRLRYGPFANSQRAVGEDEHLRIHGQALTNQNQETTTSQTHSRSFSNSHKTEAMPDCHERKKVCSAINSLEVRRIGMSAMKSEQLTAKCLRKKAAKPVPLCVIREGKERGEGEIDSCSETDRITSQIKNVAKTSSSAGDVAGEQEKQKRKKTKKNTKSEVTSLEESEDSSLKWTTEETISPSSMTSSSHEDFEKRECEEACKGGEGVCQAARWKSPKRKYRRPSASKRISGARASSHGNGKSSSRKKCFKGDGEPNINKERAEKQHAWLSVSETEKTPVFRKFYEMPNSKPKCVCFDYPGVDLTHIDVRESIERVIPDAFNSGKVVSVQFENVNIKLGTNNRLNRWHVELADFATRNKLIKSGLEFQTSNRDVLRGFPPNSYSRYDSKSQMSRVDVKLYDSVIIEEYKLFLKNTTAADEKLRDVILLCAGRGHQLLSTML